MKTIWFFRILIFLLVLFVMTKPERVGLTDHAFGDWVVLLDQSSSMQVKDPVKRFDDALGVIEKLKGVKNITLFTFSDKVLPTTLNEVQNVKPVGKTTDLAMALKTSLNLPTVKGVLLLSDGRNLSKDDPVSVVSSFGKPVFTIGFGGGLSFKDIAIKNIQSPPFAFKNIATSLSAQVSVIGFPNQEITIFLKSGDTIIASEKIISPKEEFESSVNFSFTPQFIGNKKLKIQTAVLDGEVTGNNNSKDIHFDVGRDRFRVLYLCGVPGPEYSFLRHQFKSDPGVELVTFVILRNNQNILDVPENELSLIPFPTQDALITQMSTFDLIVFEEFSYPNFGLSPALVFAIEKRVRDGGSFLLTGTPAVLGPGSPYNIPGVKEMIPVEFGNEQVQFYPGQASFVVRASEHPIFRLDENSGTNKKIWENLPLLKGITLFPKVKESGSVLGYFNIEGKEYPALTVMKVGKGKSAVLSTRSTYRWSMLPGKNNFDGVIGYQKFWKNMVVWLTRSGEFKPLRLEVDSQSLQSGGTSSLRAWLVDDYFKPVEGAQIKCEVKMPNGKLQLLTLNEEALGVYSSLVEFPDFGRYEIKAWAIKSAKKCGQDLLHLDVQDNIMEDEDLRSNLNLLKEIAHSSGGIFLLAKDFSENSIKQFDESLKNKSGKKILIWNSPWLFAIIFLLLMGEWFLRRKRGLK
ncbi:MAG: hypothetical protein ACKVQC_03410 [Elusimicrobiota bacterium]